MKKRIILINLSATLLAMHIAALQALAGGSACTTGSQVKICVEWSRSPNPVDGVDFVT